ncbi:hypothetical protein R3X27_18040 [Tropicimonas sp. TH_r6]|uniref:hypothetical protein n=1 Tax=Tropicimonas sp. TH_r6 TaxID=3082085 RepID=UPI0029550939|nr:hypothetical protein [Tropicimonas sp. TH_r6]MDV7144583.1 hypothetical protein [Tropicimonas sp. TH_r6]
MLGFRALQAIMDLRATAGRQPRSAIKGIEARIPPADRARGADAQALTRLILHQGARLETEQDQQLLDALLFAATQPEADPAAFAAATAILLADRLQSGLGQDDLGQFWSSFHPAYFALPAHDRAAIAQSFLAGASLGRVRLPDPEPQLAHLTQGIEKVVSDLLQLASRDRAKLVGAVEEIVGSQMAPLVLPQLRMLLAGIPQQPLTGDSPLFEPLLAMASNPSHMAFRPATALLLLQAVQSRDDEGWFSITLWPETVETWLGLDEMSGRPILAGLRYLYEVDPRWAPQPNRMADPQRMEGISLLPVLDESFSGGQSGARVG